jgi:4-amino-4-deoxy-L-arabinose transferase-like glycosyltransferase
MRATPALLASAIRQPASHWALMAILAVATYVRFSELDLAWFAGDAARDARMGLQIVHGNAFPMVGPEVGEGPSRTWGPLYFYLVAVPFAFSHDPTVAVGFLSLLNLVSVYLTYRFGTVFFGRAVGLVSAALFATYPAAVISARALWNLAPMPLFTVAFFYCLFAVVVAHRSVMIIPAVAMLSCLVQFHLSTVSFFAVLVIALIIYRPPLRLSHLALSGGTLVLGLLPYSLAATRSGGQEAQATVSYVLAHLSAPTLDGLLASIRLMFFISSDMTVWLTRGVGEGGGPRAWSLLAGVESALMLIGAVCPLLRLGWAWRAGISPRSPALARHGLLALWIWMPFLILNIRSGGLMWHYFQLLYPGCFVAAAVVLCDIGEQWPRRGHLRLAWSAGIAFLVLLIAISQIDFARRLRMFILSRGVVPIPMAIMSGSGGGDFELMPIRFRKRIVASAVAQAGTDRNTFYRRVHGSPFEIVLEDNGFFFDWLSRTSRRAEPLASPAPLHLAVVRGDLGDHFAGALARERVGPFTVVAYTPLIDYGSWVYSHERERGGNPTALGGGAWTPREIPTRSLPDARTWPHPPLASWPGLPILIRGDVLTSRAPDRLRLVVAVRDLHDGQHQLDACWMNGHLVPAQSAFHTLTPCCKTIAVSFDLSGHLREGRNVFQCRISGRGNHFDLDVYEVGEAGVDPTPAFSPGSSGGRVR